MAEVKIVVDTSELDAAIAKAERLKSILLDVHDLQKGVTGAPPPPPDWPVKRAG